MLTDALHVKMLLTDVQQEESTRMSPEIAKALAHLPKPSSGPTTPAARVQALRQASATYDTKLLAMLGPPPATISEFYHTITMRDGFQSKLKICQPANASTATTIGPLVLLFFSGAFITGTLYNATVVSVAYRLAPEHPFPTAVHDAIDTVYWAANNAVLPMSASAGTEGKVLHADPRTAGFILGGASSGGNLAAVLTHYFSPSQNQHTLPQGVRISGQYVGVAQLFPDDGSTVPDHLRGKFISRQQNATAPILNVAALAAGAAALRCKDLSSPLRFPPVDKGSMAELPRTYIQSCGMDPLRDDGLIYDELLKEAGVQTKVDFYAGAPHAFWLVTPLEGEESEVGREAVVDVLGGIGWLLGRNVDKKAIREVL
ncbi:AB hydrolase superfamily protein B1A11.02 [Cyphellophora attinorum]|uniref:AB hydrolase superfamily protein B1A11.02 n=1 Tax=Cyphellophora attinorum TaxID=1664694 RepID=A0A0N0NMI3_9EURO|nr:AB hydrolase superfamily protein B1A11.02 [Phialophora attinorum]KPI40388.1 AB hydrolase superfamily protein B1A11.02 [Phialophora attinorum]